jgi:hypothetical protein
MRRRMISASGITGATPTLESLFVHLPLPAEGKPLTLEWDGKNAQYIKERRSKR